jgi:predicted RNase H-like nuclease (RuvC/YqgF family)
MIRREREQQQDNNKDTKKRKKLRTFAELIEQLERNHSYETRHVDAIKATLDSLAPMKDGIE